MKNWILIMLISLLFYSCQESKESAKTRQYLSEGWQFKAKNDKAWQAANCPGVVHLDLLALGKIEDPYFGTNEDSLQWIGESHWEYFYEFKAKSFQHYKHVDLVFEGLDTYAKVFFNDSLILEADNMYRTWRLPIQDLLEQENNTIKIEFLPAEAINQEKIDRNPQTLPDYRAHTRKAPYHFGWDWGPKFLTAGIWKPVYIEAWEHTKINQVQIVQNQLNETEALLHADIELNSDFEGHYQCIIKNAETQEILAETNISSAKSRLEFSIENPKLWWTHDLGEAHLYKLSIELRKKQTLIDSISKTIGLRTIELVQEEDSIGRSFYFKLNGEKLFIKGANYIPNDNFLPRVKKERYQSVIESAIWANMNMLRVWGGGIYESDDFYNLCDQKGILVWQDFMFACAMYPGDSAFIESIRQEAIDNVTRLRHHPSIALWCGNNEVDNGWKDWGWQKQLGYSKADSTAIWQDYLHLFHKVLPEVVKTYDADRTYWPSSPEYGWGHDENMKYGDSHYWGVWWGFEPFEVFNEKVPRFMSEYGFQAMPNYKTIEAYTKKDERFLISKSLQVHQKHPRGFETINHYMRDEYISPEPLEDYTYVSQLLQAQGMQIAIEAQRRAQPYCMGTLYWQLNDCWPVCSWSTVDYYMRKKASHYMVKEAYKPIILSAYLQDEQLDIHAVSNAPKETALKLSIEQLSFGGSSIKKIETELALKNHQSVIAQSIKISELKSKANSYLYIKLENETAVVDEAFFYFAKTKDLNLPAAKVRIEQSKEGQAYKINLHSPVLCKNIELIANIEGEFEQNYFDLNAGTNKSIYFYPKEDKALKITYRCINNLY